MAKKTKEKNISEKAVELIEKSAEEVKKEELARIHRRISATPSMPLG